MNALGFPNMISNNKSIILYDKEATLSNLKNLLYSDKLTLFGDPYFGANLQKLLFEHNNVILQDLVIDEIYSVINTYMPQIKVLRKNIKITSYLNTVRIDIKAQNLLDYSFDDYAINLMNVEEI